MSAVDHIALNFWRETGSDVVNELYFLSSVTLSLNDEERGLFSFRHNREFKKLRRPVQRKRHIKIEFCVRLSVLFCDYSLLITLHVRLLGTNGFHVKAENERFTAEVSRCRRNLKYENFTSSLGRLRW